MRTLILTAAILSLVPTLRAQQTDTKQNPPQAAPQETTENSNVQNSLPAAIRPGHPLDPADVDILTGKRDREIEASRRGVPVVGGSYGAYASAYAMNGRRSAVLDYSPLPFTRTSNPFSFFNLPPRGFGRRGFRGAR
jgi:hypothetical protein